MIALPTGRKASGRLPRPPTAVVCYTSGVKTNILIIFGFGLILMFMEGVNHSIGFEFLFIAAAFVLAGMVLLDEFGGKKRDFSLVAWIGTGLFVMFMVVGPTIGNISLYRAGNEKDARTSDNVVQIDAAADFLVHGKNPYVETYYDTPLATLYQGKIAPNVVNPALEHLISLPGDLMLTTALRMVAVAAVGWFDVRILYLALFFIAAAVAYKLGTDAASKLRSVLLVCCNPFLIAYLVEGRSDILPLTFLLIAFLALHRKRQVLAMAMFAVACGMKAFAWVLIPVFLVLLVVRASDGSWKERLRRSIVPLVVCAGVIAVQFLPFLLWNAHAFIESTIRYPNGSAAMSYLVSGNGLGYLLLKLGIIRTALDYYPFWIFQAAVLVPLLIVYIPRLMKKPKVSLGLFVGALMLFGNQYVARYFFFNHLGLMLSLVAAGFGFMALERGDGRQYDRL